MRMDGIAPSRGACVEPFVSRAAEAERTANEASRGGRPHDRPENHACVSAERGGRASRAANTGFAVAAMRVKHLTHEKLCGHAAEKSTVQSPRPHTKAATACDQCWRAAREGGGRAGCPRLHEQRAMHCASLSPSQTWEARCTRGRPTLRHDANGTTLSGSTRVEGLFASLIGDSMTQSTAGSEAALRQKCRPLVGRRLLVDFRPLSLPRRCCTSSTTLCNGVSAQCRSDGLSSARTARPLLRAHTRPAGKQAASSRPRMGASRPRRRARTFCWRELGAAPALPRGMRRPAYPRRPRDERVPRMPAARYGR